MITAEQKQNRDWGLGGSDAAAALNLNPYKSRMALWMEKVGLTKAPDLDDREPVFWGNALEDLIARVWADRNKVEIRRSNKTLIHKDRSWMYAHLDRRVLRPKAILEVKNLNAWTGNKLEAPLDAHVIQVAHYMLVTGLALAHIAYLVGGNRLESFTVERDPDLLDMVYELEGQFWQHVETNTPPPLVTSEDIALLYKTSKTVAMEASEDIYNDVLTLRGFNRQIKELEAQAEAIKERIKLAMVDHDTLLWEGQPVVTWKTSKPSMRLDAKALQSRYPKASGRFLTEQPGNRPFLLKV